MATYMTKQRKALLDFLEQHPHTMFSALEIYSALQSQNISQSAVYRNLTDLEQTSKIKRHSKQGTNEAFYQYMHCSSCQGKIHLCCTCCHASFHMDAQQTEQLVGALGQNNSFLVNTADTVIYGLCGECQARC